MHKKELSMVAYRTLLLDLKDDLGGNLNSKDVTTSKLIPKRLFVKTVISNREDITICGLNFISHFIKNKFPNLELSMHFKDGDFLKKNSTVCFLNGSCETILKIERTVLNFMQHLSSISTQTKKFVEILKNTGTILLDTRKTMPGLRALQKYATKIGGAQNHRMNLNDDILIKDNHIISNGGFEKTLKKIKFNRLKNFKIECENFDDVLLVIKYGGKYILLDNMKVDEISKCIFYKNKNKLDVKFEITGGVNIENIKKYSKLKADFISIGKLTNSLNSVDIGLDII